MRLMKRLLANRRNISFSEAETQDKILAILVFLDRFMYSVDLTTISQKMTLIHAFAGVNKQIRHCVTGANGVWLDTLELIMYDEKIKQYRNNACNKLAELISMQRLNRRENLTPYRLLQWYMTQTYECRFGPAGVNVVNNYEHHLLSMLLGPVYGPWDGLGPSVIHVQLEVLNRFECEEIVSRVSISNATPRYTCVRKTHGIRQSTSLGRSGKGKATPT